MRNGTYRHLGVWVVLVAVVGGAAAAAAAGPVGPVAELANAKVQEDFPAMCVDGDGTPWVVYVSHDGKADSLKIAKKTDAGLKAAATLAGPGIIHQPAVACDGKGMFWAVWSQVNAENVMELLARRVVAGKAAGKTITLAASDHAEIFADAGTDRSGRVWVVWQSFRNGYGDIYARTCEAGATKWGKDIRVTSHAAGDWEPRLAFAKTGAAVVFDSSRSGDYDVYLATVTADGAVKKTRISKTPRHEARASVAATPDGKGYWVAWENGRERWGRDSRSTGRNLGLNTDKHIDVAYVDGATGKVTLATNPTSAIKSAGIIPAKKPAKQPEKKAAKKPPKKPAKQPVKKPVKKPVRRRRPGGVPAVNLPKIAVDSTGAPWLACRYYRGTHWKVALTKYDTGAKAWTKAVTLPNSSFSQDKNCSWAGGATWLAWPSDKRTSKRSLVSGVYVAKIDTAAAPPLAAKPAAKPGAKKPAAPAKRVARWGEDTPERLRSDRHFWTPAKTKYGLYWGDFHRHTDISNCITAGDGCIVEQYRYAYDMGKLDFMGPSDHTDIAKPYSPYEWWCNQKLTDVFFSPGFFTSFYVYEREQRWPWGHRNVIFAERGGPVVYIKRALYKSMPWHATLPIGDGGAEILPPELWKVLRKHGRPVTVISHTGATGMGTNWDGYKKIDNAVENVVEIYQGARVSYEGINTPQPLVALPKKTPKAGAGVAPTTGKDFGKYNKGVYQNALSNGWKLGVFANSDHISTNTTFGGVYAESFTREGIIKAINARRTIAGTDKIFIEFSCNGHLLGSIFETSDKPAMTISVRGTAKLKAVTIVRNEKNLKRFTPKNTKKFDVKFTDDEPIAGENRYYVRVEQVDGNMGWASPVWVTFKSK